MAQNSTCRSLVLLWLGLSKTRVCTVHHRHLRGKIAMDTLTPSPTPVVYKMSGPMGGGFLTHHWRWGWKFYEVNFSKEWVPPLYKNLPSEPWMVSSTCRLRSLLFQAWPPPGLIEWILEVHSVRVAGLQNEAGMKDFVSVLSFIRKTLRDFPIFEALSFVGPKSLARFLPNFPQDPRQKTRQIHRRASAGAQER